MIDKRLGLICTAVAVAGIAAAIGASIGAASKKLSATAAPQPQTCPRPVLGEQRTIPAGTFAMGSDSAYPEEGPKHMVTVAGFNIDRYEVTNAQFAEFVAATGYVTEAERNPDPAAHPDIDPSKLVPGSAVFEAPQEPTADMGWWHFVPGANWRAPFGAGSTIKGQEFFPVVHVTYGDAQAYAKWRGRRLPTEVEWERAASGGRDSRFVWGTELAPDGKWRANTWQGAFPFKNTGADGFIGVAPVGCFESNDYGLNDMIGNVWELTADVYGGDGKLAVIKGGSYLCAENYCARYRASARQPLERDFSASHVGFRTAADL
jgi:formylglycine-generating enzyme required for sulfatase activity